MRLCGLRPQAVHVSTREHKDEIGRKTIGVALNLLVQTFCRHAINFGQVSIEDDLLATHSQNERINGLLH